MNITDPTPENVARLIGWLAECYRLSGADDTGGMTGGVNEDWRLAGDAVEAVRDLRRDYDEGLDAVIAGERAVAECARLRAELEAANNTKEHP